MIAALSNHLWQSTLFVIAAGALALALRKNGAHVRHAIWIVASLKFLVPFSLVMSLGSALSAPTPVAATWQTPIRPTSNLAVAVDRVAQPFTDDLFAAPPRPPSAPGLRTDRLVIALTGIWVCGIVVVGLMRLRGWQRVRAALRASTPWSLTSPIPVRSAPGLLEPGIVGLWRPVLLMPQGIEQRLTTEQLETVLAHERCHVLRRDNLTSAIHMLVEAVFWFHPFVWLVGARIVDERERACDEYVLRVCRQPQTYAESIVNVCKFYTESPLTCVSGVTGSDLKRRLSAIMVNRVGLQLNTPRKVAVTIAATLAIGLPLVAGLVTAPLRASALEFVQGAAASSEKFDVVSIKPCEGNVPPVNRGAPPRPGFRAGIAPWTAQATPGSVYWDCALLSELIDQAYADAEHPLLNSIRPGRRDTLSPKRVRGGPSWVDNDKFTVEAKAPLTLTNPALNGAPSRNVYELPPTMSQALRQMLEDRFQLKVHRATEQQDMFALTIAKSGLNKQKVTTPVAGDCQTIEQYAAAAAQAPPRTPGTIPVRQAICGRGYSSMEGMEFSSFTFPQLANYLSSSLDYYVLDRTGVTDPFNFDLKGPAGDNANPFGPGAREEILSRRLEALGLKMDRIKAPAEYLVIDRAEKPRPDLPAEFIAPPARVAGAGKPR